MHVDVYIHSLTYFVFSHYPIMTLPFLPLNLFFPISCSYFPIFFLSFAAPLSLTAAVCMGSGYLLRKGRLARSCSPDEHDFIIPPPPQGVGPLSAFSINGGVLVGPVLCI